MTSSRGRLRPFLRTFLGTFLRPFLRPLGLLAVAAFLPTGPVFASPLSPDTSALFPASRAFDLRPFAGIRLEADAGSWAAPEPQAGGLLRYRTRNGRGRALHLLLEAPRYEKRYFDEIDIGNSRFENPLPERRFLFRQDADLFDFGLPFFDTRRIGRPLGSGRNQPVRASFLQTLRSPSQDFAVLASGLGEEEDLYLPRSAVWLEAPPALFYTGAWTWRPFSSLSLKTVTSGRVQREGPLLTGERRQAAGLEIRLAPGPYSYLEATALLADRREDWERSFTPYFRGSPERAYFALAGGQGGALGGGHFALRHYGRSLDLSPLAPEPWRGYAPYPRGLTEGELGLNRVAGRLRSQALGLWARNDSGGFEKGTGGFGLGISAPSRLGFDSITFTARAGTEREPDLRLHPLLRGAAALTGAEHRPFFVSARWEAGTVFDHLRFRSRFREADLPAPLFPSFGYAASAVSSPAAALEGRVFDQGYGMGFRLGSVVRLVTEYRSVWEDYPDGFWWHRQSLRARPTLRLGADGVRPALRPGGTGRLSAPRDSSGFDSEPGLEISAEGQWLRAEEAEAREARQGWLAGAGLTWRGRGPFQMRIGYSFAGDAELGGRDEAFQEADLRLEWRLR